MGTLVPNLWPTRRRGWDWYPSTATLYLWLMVAIVVGGVVCFRLGPMFGTTGINLVTAYASGITLMFLGALGTLLQWARTQTPARILAILGLALVHAIALVSLLALTQLNTNGIDTGQSTRWLLVGGIINILFSAACFTRVARRGFAHLMPLESDNFIHAYVLAAGVGIIGWALLSLIPFQQPLLYGLVTDDIVAATTLDSPLITVTSLVSTTIWSVPAALLAVGFGVSRSLRQALIRLGIERVSLRLIALGAVSAVLLVVAALVLTPLIHALWTYLDWPVTDLQVFAEIANLPVDLWGILLVGISAGVSEELLVRGVLQPRLGLITANLLFALGHAFQYGADGLLVVLMLGLVFGIMRQRWGLIPAIVSHALYDIVLLEIAVLFPDIVS